MVTFSPEKNKTLGTQRLRRADVAVDRRMPKENPPVFIGLI